MAQESSLIVEYGELLITGALAISTITLGILNYRRSTRIKALEDTNEYLKKEIHKVTSKVDPESDRKLLIQARESVQILGINSLGPLHHCREEIIHFLGKKNAAIEIVLLHPTTKTFREREQKEHDNTERLLSEWQTSVRILKDIQLHSSGHIRLRLRSDTPDRSLFIVDSIKALSERSKMLVNYYPDEPGMRGYSGSQFLAEFEMERDRDAMFKNWEHFRQCWEHATPVSIDDAMRISALK